MKTQYATTARAFLVLTVALGLGACDTLNKDQEEAIPQEELEIASQIIGSSLSDAESGLLSGIYDAISDINEDSIRYEWPGMYGEPGRKRNMAGKDKDKDGHGDRDRDRYRECEGDPDCDHTANRARGSESNYNAEYNPETGEHTVWFIREFEGPVITRNLNVRSVYIFTDADGAFLEFPRRQQDQIETIDFKGTREGSTEGPFRSNRFYRFDTFYLEGVSSESRILTLQGSHEGNGEMTVELLQRETVMERSYEVSFDLEDIRIDKVEVMENGTLEEGITGFITYNLAMSRTVNGETRDRDISGVVELTGDGTALLRFNKLNEIFRIALDKGTVTRPGRSNS
ncbi:MAG: hypothetical protein R6U28_07760 [Cyclonatronaceae bacterium]